MIVSRLRRFIYVRTIKTASSSLEMALAKICGPDDTITPLNPLTEEPWKRERDYRGPQHIDLPLRGWTLGNLHMRLRGNRPVFYNHMPARAIRRAVGEATWSSYMTFSVDRNPWDRLVSHYFWRTRDEVRELRRETGPRPTLAQYVRSLDPAEISNWGRYAVGDRPIVKRVLRFEHLEAELTELIESMGWPPLDPLPMAKRATRPPGSHYRDLLTASDRSFIAAACAREIALLGYRF